MTTSYERSYCETPCSRCPFRRDADVSSKTREDIAGLLAQPSVPCERMLYKECAGHMHMRWHQNVYVRIMRRLQPGFAIKGRELVFSDDASLLAHYPPAKIFSVKTDLQSLKKVSNEEDEAIYGNSRLKMFTKTNRVKREPV